MGAGEESGSLADQRDLEKPLLKGCGGDGNRPGNRKRDVRAKGSGEKPVQGCGVMGSLEKTGPGMAAATGSVKAGSGGCVVVRRMNRRWKHRRWWRRWGSAKAGLEGRLGGDGAWIGGGGAVLGRGPGSGCIAAGGSARRRRGRRGGVGQSGAERWMATSLVEGADLIGGNGWSSGLERIWAVLRFWEGGFFGTPMGLGFREREGNRGEGTGKEMS